MKIKLYLVTYNRIEILNSTLNSLFASNIPSNLEINIINNHSNFSLKEEYSNSIKVLHNSLRPDFSTGHLSRNWNQAIINGFKNINNPDADIVITCQDDTNFNFDWLNKLINYHSHYNFITQGAGDCFCSYTIDAIKNIGLWDERFCNIGYQEADYFFRALIHNKDKSSINDNLHNRVLNPIGNFIFKSTEDHKYSEDHLKSMEHHNLTLNLFKKKWNVEPASWNNSHFNYQINSSLIENYIYYPYFEKDIPNLKNKNYFMV